MDRVIPKILGTSACATEPQQPRRPASLPPCHTIRMERQCATQMLTLLRYASHWDRDAAPNISQAMKELARGEQTASALENHLDSLEKKIEELLAQAEKAEKDMQTSTSKSEQPSSQDQSKSS